MAAESRGFDSALEKCALFYREGRRANVPDHSGACTDGELLPGVYVSFDRAQGDDLGGQHVSAHPAGHPDGQPVCRNLEVALDLPVQEDVLLTGQPAPNRHGLADESRVGRGPPRQPGSPPDPPPPFVGPPAGQLGRYLKTATGKRGSGTTACPLRRAAVPYQRAFDRGDRWDRARNDAAAVRFHNSGSRLGESD